MANYAIVIGINDYKAPEEQGLKTLEGAIPDAQKMAAWLTTKGGVPLQNCHLITSKLNPLNPIKDDVDKAIVEVIKAVVNNDNKDGDRFYFYFAGHGLGVELDRDNNGMCMANWSEYMRDAAALSSSDYRQKFLNEGLFKEVVIWMDCCRNTKLFLKPQGGPGIVPLGPNLNPKWIVGFATQYQNQAFESTTTTAAGTETRGIFTRVLLEGLNGAASQNGAPIATADLVDYLYFHVPTAAQEAGFTQMPDIATNTGRNFTIVF